MNEPAIAGLTVGSAPALSASQRPLWRRLAPIGVVAIVAAALTGIVLRLADRATPAPAITRFALTLPEGQQFSGLGRRFIAISPDGSQVIYAGNSRLYLRAMNDFEPRAIQGTETPQGVTSPVFSPDGRDVAFFSGADQTLKRIAIAGGVAITICQVEEAPMGMTWTHDSIMFGQAFGQAARGILRVSSNGGKPESLLSVGRSEAFLGPQMLPGDQAVLFTVAAAGDLDKAQIAVQSLASGERKTLTEGSDARYLTTGHIVYWLRGTIFAVAFDASRLQLVGAPVPVVQGVRRPVGSSAANFSVSETGSLIYVPGPTNASLSRASGLVLVNRNGHEEALMVPPAPYEVSRFSPDGKQVAVGTDDGKEANIWVYQISGTSSIRQLTFGGRNRYPVWAANGQRIAFQSDREGAPGIFWQRADGSDTAERLTKPDEGTSHVPESWSQTGERLSFSAMSSGSAAETATPATLWTISVNDKNAVPFGDIRSRTALNSTFSPDGRWLAYTLRSSRATVNVQPFPPTGARYQIREDAHHPMWSADGKELFYLGSGNIANITGLLAVSFTLQPSPAFGIPVTVTGSGRFRATYGGPRTYDVAPDGKSFIAVGDATPTESGVPAAPQIRVVLNWTEELKAHVPVK
jgi:Tol biopolymer transport system component